MDYRPGMVEAGGPQEEGRLNDADKPLSDVRDLYILQRYSRFFKEHKNFKNWSVSFLALVAMASFMLTFFGGDTPLVGLFSGSNTPPHINLFSAGIFAISTVLLSVILYVSRKI